MSTLFIDLETRSRIKLGRGMTSHRYAEDPSTEILMGAYAQDDGIPKIADAEGIRKIFSHAVFHKHTIVAHN